MIYVVGAAVLIAILILGPKQFFAGAIAKGGKALIYGVSLIAAGWIVFNVLPIVLMGVIALIVFVALVYGIIRLVS